MARQTVLQRLVDAGLCIEVRGQLRLVAAHPRLSGLNGGLGLHRARLLQAKSRRYQPVHHVTLFGPGFLLDHCLTFAQLQVENAIFLFIKAGLY